MENGALPPEIYPSIAVLYNPRDDRRMFLRRAVQCCVKMPKAMVLVM
jgi:hypothetical protein